MPSSSQASSTPVIRTEKAKTHRQNISAVRLTKLATDHAVSNRVQLDAISWELTDTAQERQKQSKRMTEDQSIIESVSLTALSIEREQGGRNEEEVINLVIQNHRQPGG